MKLTQILSLTIIAAMIVPCKKESPDSSCSSNTSDGTTTGLVR